MGDVYEKAFEYLEILQKILDTENGDDDAQYQYACCLEKGDGVIKNTKEACHYYQIAAYKGNTNAM